MFLVGRRTFVLTACSGEGYPPGAVAYVGRSESACRRSEPERGRSDASEENATFSLRMLGMKPWPTLRWTSTTMSIRSIRAQTLIGMRADIAADVSTDVRPIRSSMSFPTPT